MNNVLNKNKLKLFNTSNSDLLTRLTALENNVYKITYYEIISGASGSLSIPAQATINAGEFAGLNCILSEVDGSNKPTWITPKTAGGTVVTATLNTSTGAWVKSGVTTSANVALIYSLDIKALYYSNLNNAFILEETITPSLDYIISNTTLNSVTSTSLAGVMSDETGNGPLVFGTAPNLTNPTVTTQVQGDNSTKAASTAYVDTGLATKQNLIGFTPENVANKDTDGTLAANSDTKYASQKATKTYADTKIASTYLDTDGTLAANSDTKIATQKATKTYIDTGLTLKANLASPTFTGDPQAPTPTIGDNDTSISTTAFVTTAIQNDLGRIIAISKGNYNF